MAVASYLLATGLSEVGSLFDVSNFSISQLACHSALHSSFEPRLLFAKAN